MLNTKFYSGILIALLAVNLSMLTLATTVKPAKAVPDPWELPVVYIQAIPLPPSVLLVNVGVYNLTNTWYPSNWRWVEGGPLPPSVTGAPVALYYYSLGNLYAFDIAVSWNPAVLQYVSVTTTVPRTRAPRSFGPMGILNPPVISVGTSVDPVAGTCRAIYSQQYPALSFNNASEAANVVTIRFNVLGAGDYGLSLDMVDLVLDPMFWGRTPNMGVQPEIPWRAVLDPALTTNVGVEVAPRNKDVVGEGKAFDTYALVKNTGTSSKTFDVKIFAGATQVGTASATVAAGTQQTVKVACSTTGLAKGTYTIRAQAVPVAGETYTADNEITQGSIIVTLPGDVDGSKNVNIFDIVKMAGGYGAANQAATNYDPYADLDNNYIINIFDIVTAAGNYGKSWT